MRWELFLGAFVAQALDAAGREALRTLERHIVNDVLFAPNPEPEHYWEKHDDGHMNATEHVDHPVFYVWHAYPVGPMATA